MLLNMLQLYYILCFFFGLSAGSFLNASVWRTRENLTILKGRSMCPHCRQKINWYDNIPLISFVILKGKCRFCKGKISWQYPVVELVMGLVFLITAIYGHGTETFMTPELLRDWGIIYALVFIFVYDLKYQEILDRSTLPFAVGLYLLSLALNWHPWWSMLLGAAIGSGFFLVQFLVSKGKWVGGGDIRLGLFMGVILGWPYIILALMLAYVMGAIASLFLIAFKNKNLKSETAFGTYLSLATLASMFWGKVIVDWYVGLLK